MDAPPFRPRLHRRGRGHPAPDAGCAMLNRKWVLAVRPEGEVTAKNFRFEQVETAPLAEGEVLVRHRLVSIDPYVRGRMSAAKSYSQPMTLGSVIAGAALGDIVASRDPAFRPGETVMVGGGELPGGGWQESSVAPAATARRIEIGGLADTAFFVPLGMPGFTAYCGLMKIGRPKPGETVVVSAATGGVGSMVGQFAKAEGCRVVAIAGGAEKCAFAVKELGYDAAVDHRAPDFERLLASACPAGIDIYFESVGGRVADAVRPLLNDFARIPVCGLISQYNNWGNNAGTRLLEPFLHEVLVKRLTVRGFIISDHFADRPEFIEYARPLVEAGRLVWRDHVVEGLEAAPDAFMGLLRGQNFGKLVVRIS